MSRRLYLALVLVRLYFGVQPSYIHPDEHFQGPEIITGEIFGWPSYKTWEFTSDRPIRSIFPLWLVYGPALTVLKWLSDALGYSITPTGVFYALRILMFLFSFILEDWAIHELIPDKRERRISLLLVASSYVTWTFQMHTFSNSIETIVVLWCIVLMRRLMAEKEQTLAKSCVALAFLGVLGVFNRITFPASVIVPAIQLMPHLLTKPWRAPIILLAGGIITLIAIATDTEYYTGALLRFRELPHAAVITPLNNLLYNLDATNLAEHGLHPFWQHFAANLPQLIGPAYILLVTSSRKDALFWSGIVGTGVLSCFKHQEARFLLPAVPLLLASISLPKRYAREWCYAWTAFNVLAAVVFGLGHQAGVVPVQSWIAQRADVAEVLWWKTYSPPRWLLGEANVRVETTDLMGMPGAEMMEYVEQAARCRSSQSRALLVAPANAQYLEALATTNPVISKGPVTFEQVHGYRQHLGLDDMDWGEDGVWATLQRVIGRRGLKVWQLSKEC